MARKKKTAPEQEAPVQDAAQNAPVQEAPAPEAPAPAPKAKAAPKAKPAPARKAPDMVAVALNYPGGIDFRLKSGKTVRIAGNAGHLRGKETGVLPVGAFGFTMVPRAQWEELKAVYGRHPLFRNGLIYASSDRESAADEAADHAGTRSGFEPVDPERTETSPAPVGEA